ncbi:hypothetical protein AAHA92_01849 [Salvia divinorum]|uniref:Uncharacterized protein n=1 Tax=Salvia divinorum TaxID=28513 RepID=A0ABD1IFX1_SALDI
MNRMIDLDIVSLNFQKLDEPGIGYGYFSAFVCEENNVFTPASAFSWDNLQTVGYLKKSFLIYPVSEVPPRLSISVNLSKHYWEDRGPNPPVHSLTPGEA